MNYLAHAYLSFNQPALLLGNMMSDFVKGKQQFQYPGEIQQGIRLHRAIDDFTDHHVATKDAKEIFKPYYRLYSAAFVDIVYDHFLATSAQEFPDFELQQFCDRTYHLLEFNKVHFHPGFATVFEHMKKQNWLFNYHTFNGVLFSFQGLTRRAIYIDDYQPAFELFQKEYKTFKVCYDYFFPELKNFTLKWIEKNDIILKID